MLDDLVPTLATNRSTAPGHDHNFYVTFFDDVNNRYVNESHNATEVNFLLFFAGNYNWVGSNGMHI